MLLSKYWFPLRYHEKQQQLYHCDAQYVAVVAGRGSGKTEISYRKLIRSLPIPIPNCPRPIYIYGAPTHDQAKRLGWQKLNDLIPEEWVVKRDVKALTIQTKYGSELRVVGLDKAERLEGSQLCGVVLDESSDLKPGTYSKSIFPMLSHFNGWCWRIGVPKRAGPSATEFKAFFDRCMEKQKKPNANHAAFHWFSSSLLSEKKIAEYKAEMDDRDFREQFEASWESSSGGIFYSYNRLRNHRPKKFIKDARIIVGCDFNVDPMSWCVGQRNKKEMYWMDEIFLKDSNTEKALDKLAYKYGDHPAGFTFYGDASASSRKTSASSSDKAQIRKDKRFDYPGNPKQMKFNRGNPVRVDRFASCNMMFFSNDEPRMFIDMNECPKLVEDLEQRVYKPGTRNPDDGEMQGHMSDAMGYAVHKMFPAGQYQPVGGTAEIVIESHA